jgi:hypothetical protein
VEYDALDLIGEPPDFRQIVRGSDPVKRKSKSLV